MLPDSPKSRAENPSALPPGTRLGEFELLSLLGVGGFGIVYLAFDHALEREVAVKEYMPASLAGRTETMHVSVRSQSDAETFALGLKSFVNEARLLARFDHPSLLKVLRFWEANGTAYMAMPVMRGHTLKEARAAMTVAPDEAWLRAVLDPLLGAIERLHSEGVYHRDIAPDNIQIEPGGRPVLLDFGAARRVISDKSQTLTAILKPAYAPIEQYAEAGSVKQGPWTDLYALGATLHYMLLGRPPPPATARAVHDDASALGVDACAGCSDEFLRTIDWMLAPRPIDRPQSVAQLREVLDGRTPPPVRRAVEPVPVSQWDRTVIGPRAEAKNLPPSSRDLDATLVMPRPTMPPPTVAPPVATPPSESDAPPRRPQALAEAPAKSQAQWLPIGVALAVVVVAGAAYTLWPRSSTNAPEAAASAPVTVAAAAAASVAAAAASVAVPESAVARVEVKPVAPPPLVSLVPVTPAVPAVTEAPKPAATTVARDKPATTRPTAPAPQAAGVVATPPPQTSSPAPSSTPVPVRTEAPAPSPPTVASQPEPPKPVVQGPEATCAGRNFLSHIGCMERACLRSEFTSHPDCLAWRKNARRE